MSGSETSKRIWLIEQYIETLESPRFSPELRIRGKGVPVWALVGYIKVILKVADLTASASGIASVLFPQTPEAEKRLARAFKRVAKEYGLELDEVRAAWAYYRQDPAEIDAKLVQNRMAID